jgi:phospholipid/cholesterol/gamma-HCH transport system substrate-binding protein
MPRTRSLAWSELKIGMLSVFAVVMAALLIFAVGGAGGFFWQRYPLKTHFPNIATVKSGTPVRVSGIEVGVVTAIEFNGVGADAVLEVANEVRPLITDRSVAVIGAISMLGEGAIDITAAPGGAPIADWGYVPTGVDPTSFAALSATASEGLSETAKLVADLRAGKGTLGKLIADDGAYQDIQALTQAATRVADAVRQGRGTMGRLVNDPKIYDELAASTADLHAITGRLSRGEGSLGALLQDPALAKSATQAAANLEAMTGRLSRGEGTAGKLLTDEQLFTRLNNTAARFDDLTTKLAAGQGTAGLLLQDRQLYENMSHAVTELRGLVSDIRRDPKKYLNVKVSLF